jgi:hypothetical protein
MARPHRFASLAGRLLMATCAVGMAFVAMQCFAAPAFDLVYLLFGLFFLLLAGVGLRLATRGQPWQ